MPLLYVGLKEEVLKRVCGLVRGLADGDVASRQLEGVELRGLLLLARSYYELASIK
jgi:hypothetical protein